MVVLGHQDVGRLDVAMDEAAGMRRVERRRDLGDDARGALGLEPALARSTARRSSPRT